MKKLVLLAVFGASLAGLASCGKKSSSSNTTVACNTPNTTGPGTCITVSGPSSVLTSAGYTAGDCVADSGTVVASCTATGRFGRCAVSDPTAPTLGITVAFYAPYDATSGAAACAAFGGAWTPN